MRVEAVLLDLAGTTDRGALVTVYHAMYLSMKGMIFPGWRPK